MAPSPPPPNTLRQRNVGAATKKPKDGASSDVELDKLVKAASAKTSASSERDYQAVFVVITALAFLTRFWGISHPNEVVFDEVHFGKVRTPSYPSSRLPLTTKLTLLLPVRLVLPREDVLFRCPSSLRQAPVRLHGLAGWL
jgi:hypothetical protein